MKRKIVIMLMLGLVTCAGFSNVNAEEVEIGITQDAKIDKNVDYTICYEINENEIDTVEKVRIEGYYSILDKVFIVVSGTGFKGKEMKGYILLNSVKSILPGEGIVARRTLITEK